MPLLDGQLVNTFMSTMVQCAGSKICTPSVLNYPATAKTKRREYQNNSFPVLHVRDHVQPSGLCAAALDALFNDTSD
jgi:hypothetical protein